MSIRPVDMQITINNGSEISKMNNNQESNRPEVQNQRFGNELQKQTEINTQTVLNSNKSEQDAIHKDGKGQGGSNSNKKNRRKSEKKTSDKSMKAEKTGMFDVSI